MERREEEGARRSVKKQKIDGCNDEDEDGEQQLGLSEKK